jgi:hypothetical protein
VSDWYQVELKDRAGDWVDAQLLLGLTPKNLEDVEKLWRPLLIEQNQQDAHWNWRKLHADYRSASLSFPFFRIEAQGDLQGMMMLNLLERSRFDPELEILYVMRLAAAPWNRGRSEERVLRGVGPVLLRHAIGIQTSTI